MAITANTVWEFRADGSDDNGGGFDSTIASAGTDFSVSTAAILTITDAAHAAGSTTLTSATGGFNSGMIGNVLYIKSGPNFTTGFYQITSVANSSSLTVDKSMGASAGSSGVLSIGGCRNSISANSLPGSLTAGNTLWIKVGSYIVGAFTASVSGTSTSPIKIYGYNSTRGDDPTGENRPTLAFAGSACTLGGYKALKNIIFTTSHASGINSSSNGNFLKNCKITSTNTSPANSALVTYPGIYTNLEISHTQGKGVTLGQTGSTLHGCYVHDCSAGIAVNAAGNSVTNCIVSNVTSGIIVANIAGFSVLNNTVYGSTTSTGIGISNVGNAGQYYNNIIYGFKIGANSNSTYPSNNWDYNCFYNNSADRVNVTAGANDVSLDPGFVDAPNGNFAITGAI